MQCFIIFSAFRVADQEPYLACVCVCVCVCVLCFGQYLTSFKINYWDFLDGPGAKTPRSQYKGPRFSTWPES